MLRYSQGQLTSCLGSNWRSMHLLMQKDGTKWFHRHLRQAGVPLRILQCCIQGLLCQAESFTREIDITPLRHFVFDAFIDVKDLAYERIGMRRRVGWIAIVVDIECVVGKGFLGAFENTYLDVSKRPYVSTTEHNTSYVRPHLQALFVVLKNLISKPTLGQRGYDRLIEPWQSSHVKRAVVCELAESLDAQVCQVKGILERNIQRL